jgi:hydroxymethylcytosylglucuronate/cytosylglucuronate synthase
VTTPDVAHLVGNLPNVASVGPRPHYEFLDLLASTGLLITSPGLTTLLEASRAGTPTVCLPPQNLSQIFNAERFAVAMDNQLRVTWHPDVLDPAAVESARVHGEEAALAVIDRALAAADTRTCHEVLEADLGHAIAHAKHFTAWDGLVVDGADGAAQVATILLHLINRVAAGM